VATTIGKGQDSFKADGDGYYDIIFGYPDKNNLPGRFVADNVSVYIITATGLTAAMFEALSSPAVEREHIIQQLMCRLKQTDQCLGRC